ncbi:MAG: hypothetical protein AUJ49_03765 [Desulfovibrionaceae bacterium CG1_02_65_16]|nr:MAG: hypothetical protein AUJ49_03765 [Desulfovibrionaceae bacterium CG1_02_65_16]
MIISASRRTDIPALYAEWLMHRVRAGFCLVRNPFNARQLRRVDLSPAAVSAMVLWTRNAGPLLPYLPELEARGLRFVFQYTITGYPRALEPAAPAVQAALAAFRDLSARLGPTGPERVLWRYDPIILCGVMDEAAHVANFTRLADALAGKTARVTISFLEMYRKTVRNLARAPGLGVIDHDPARLRDLAARLAGIAGARGIVMRSCACAEDLSAIGIAPGACVDGGLLSRLFGIAAPAGHDAGQRAACRCAKSVDIGQYDTCVHGCAYCYATADAARARAHRAAHDPHSPLLSGWPDDASPSAPSAPSGFPAKPVGPRQASLI